MFHAKAIVHLSKRHVISPPPSRGFGNSGIGLFSVREFGKAISFGIREKTKCLSGILENRNIYSGIRENAFFRDSGWYEISFGNSGKSKYLFMIRELAKWHSWNRKTLQNEAHMGLRDCMMGLFSACNSNIFCVNAWNHLLTVNHVLS